MSNDNVIENTIDIKPSVVQKFISYMKFILTEMVNTLKKREFSFDKSGILITLIILLISTGFFLMPYFASGQVIDIETISIPFNILGIPISILVAILVIILWFMIGYKITPKAAHILVDNKIVKFIFTKGHVHYLEYIPIEKRKISIPHILNKYIALLIAWISVSSFLINITAGLIANGNPAAIINPGNDIFKFLVRTLIIFLLVPLIFTLIYPLAWMLIDAKLKAYNRISKLNWLVGTKVSSITTGFITLGSLVALGADVLTDIATRLQIVVDLLIFCIINVSLIVILVAVFYNIFFQGKFYNDIIRSLEIGFGITSVSLVDVDGNPIEKKSEEKVDIVKDDISPMEEHSEIINEEFTEE